MEGNALRLRNIVKHPPQHPLQRLDFFLIQSFMQCAKHAMVTMNHRREQITPLRSEIQAEGPGIFRILLASHKVVILQGSQETGNRRLGQSKLLG